MADEEASDTPGLAELFREAKLSAKLEAARALLKEWGATDWVEEVLLDPEVLDKFGDELQLKFLEKRRFEKAVNEKLTAENLVKTASTTVSDSFTSESDGIPPPDLTPAAALHMVVKKTFVSVEPENAALSRLVRSSTAPPGLAETLRRGGTHQPIQEEDEDEADLDLNEEDFVADHRPAPGLARADRTCDPYNYEHADPSTWLPASYNNATHSGGYQGHAHAVPPPMWPMMWSPDMMWPMGMGPPMMMDQQANKQSSSAASKATPSAPSRKPKPQSLDVTTISPGANRVDWTVCATKLASTNTHPVVSPGFELSFGDAFSAVRFKMLLQPKAVNESKGGRSFKKSKGRGYVELVCEESLADDFPAANFKISVGNDARMQPSRGPVRHLFAEKAVAALSHDDAEWCFKSSVDKTAGTFIIRVEVDVVP
eukprot:TRINITY_DN114094_c0_g1_i1.p1 TRINITY_DN114094_c0_g1~~TRINITY_DN114094_c0_g1_i1.p1  ORF type:complete len:428 (+),score=120.12 TRINITY_DN114094_c0_g1_i1:63-1346(+)